MRDHYYISKSSASPHRRDYSICVTIIVMSGPPHPPPLENHKAIGLLIKTGPDPIENHKTTGPAFNVGPPSVCQRKASQMVFRFWTDDGPLLVVFGSSLLSLTKKVTVAPPLTDFLDPRTMPANLYVWSEPYLHPYFGYVSNEGYDESVPMRRLT